MTVNRDTGLFEDLTAARATLDRQAREILDDGTRSDSYKEKMLETLEGNEKAKWQKRIEKEKERVEDELTATRRVAFGPPLELRGDPIAIMRDYREQIKVARELKDRAAVRELMEESRMIGDLIAEKAAMRRAVELGDGALLDSYLNQSEKEFNAYADYLLAVDAKSDFDRQIGLFGGASRLKLTHELNA